MPNALRPFNELPEWIRNACLNNDIAVNHVVKDWRMTSAPISVLYEKLAIKMYELKNTWEMTANSRKP